MPVCPLTGEPCVAPKYNTVTDIAKDGVVKSVKLCNKCLLDYVNNNNKVQKIKKKQSSSGLAKEVFDFLDGLVKMQGKKKQTGKKEIKEKPPCPSCGISMAEITKHKRLGCPDCYDHYAQELDGVLKNAHDEHTVHVGKTPKIHTNFLKPEDILIRLKRKMEAAVAKEDYETAAILRDEITRAEDAKMQKQLEKEKEKRKEEPGTEKA